MLSREQMLIVRILWNRRGTLLFSSLPRELLENEIFQVNDPNHEIHKALALAVAREENPEENKRNLTDLINMLDKNPRLVLCAGNVKTRGGLQLTRTTLLKFAICSLDPKLVRIVMHYYNHPSIENGAAVREKILQECRPHIAKLISELKLYAEKGIATYDLKPLLIALKQATPADVTALLNKNMEHQSVLQDEVMKLKDCIQIKTSSRTEGMHYPFYTTLFQASELLLVHWNDLSNNNNNFDKLDLMWRLMGSLQQPLPTMQRIPFGRGFQDNNETLQLIGAPPGVSFPDMTSLDVDFAVFSRMSSTIRPGDLSINSTMALRVLLKLPRFFERPGANPFMFTLVLILLERVWTPVVELAELTKKPEPKPTPDLILDSIVDRLNQATVFFQSLSM